MVRSAKVRKPFEMTKFLSKKMPIQEPQKQHKSLYLQAFAVHWHTTLKKWLNLGKIGNFDQKNVFVTL